MLHLQGPGQGPEGESRSSLPGRSREDLEFPGLCPLKHLPAEEPSSECPFALDEDEPTRPVRDLPQAPKPVIRSSSNDRPMSGRSLRPTPHLDVRPIVARRREGRKGGRAVQHPGTSQMSSASSLFILLKMKARGQNESESTRRYPPRSSSASRVQGGSQWGLACDPCERMQCLLGDGVRPLRS